MANSAQRQLDSLRERLGEGTSADLARGDVAPLLGNFFEAPAIGIDLDGCIDEAPEWFRVLSRIWPGPIIVITFRRDAERARRDVERFGVHADEVILVQRFEQKAEVIAERGISVYFDDQDEMLLHIPEGTTVLKIRNGGNFDFEQRKWLFSGQTGRML